MSQLPHNYRVLETVREGPNSIVYKGSRLTDGRMVAIKVMTETARRDRDLSRDFKREGRILERIRHPGIVSLVEQVTSPAPAIILDWFESKTLRVHMLEYGDFTVREALVILVQVAESLLYLHEHDVIHKDMKPENVLMNDRGLTRLIDFSLAEDGTERSLFKGRKKRQGTPRYMSPEQIRMDELDYRTDMYSFAVMAFELLTSSAPFPQTDQDGLLEAHLRRKPPTLRSRNPEVPYDLDLLIQRLLSKRPADRCAHERALVFELNKFLG